MPVRRRFAPTGCKPCSTLVRHRPSNMLAPGNGDAIQRYQRVLRIGCDMDRHYAALHRLGGEPEHLRSRGFV